MAKNLVSGPILAHLDQIRAANLFLKNLTLSVTRCQLLSCTVSEKSNDRILRKLRDEQTNSKTARRPDRRTDERE